MNRKLFYLIVWLVAAGWMFPLAVRAQLTIDSCYQLARRHYPELSRMNIIQRLAQYSIDNAARGYLPQLRLTAQGTWQSDVTKIPFEFPGVQVDALSQDQYRAMLELNQTIWDGGEIKSNQADIRAGAAVDRQQVEVGLYALRERVNQLYFGILLFTAQLEQNSIWQRQLERNYGQVAAWCEKGVAGSADLDAVRVEQIKARQDSIQLYCGRLAYCSVLALLTGLPSVAPGRLVEPEVSAGTYDAPNFDARPEMLLYDLQLQQLDTRRHALNVGLRPQLGIFMQAAYGKPGLDVLENKFSPYMVAGVRLTWNISRFYTFKSDRLKVAQRKQEVEAARQTFLLNKRMEARQTSVEIDQWQRMMNDDDELISLRANIRQAAEAKAALGVMTVNDMLQEVTAEHAARKARALHAIQYKNAVYNWKFITHED